MAIDWFLIDATHLVPRDYDAWLTAKNRHYELFRQCIDSMNNPAVSKELEVRAIEAKAEADRLEAIAREAWARKLKSSTRA